MPILQINGSFGNADWALRSNILWQRIYRPQEHQLCLIRQIKSLGMPQGRGNGEGASITLLINIRAAKVVESRIPSS